MNECPKISVIVPIYNVEKWIERCARSLFEQTLDEIEFIFVDDCTPDNSMNVLNNIIQEYPTRKDAIKIIHHEVNKGLAASRNTGLAVALGDYIAHCDSDDWLECEAYEKMYEKAVNEDLDLCYCDYRLIYIDKYEDCRNPEVGKNRVQTIRNWISNGMTSVCMFIARRTIYEDYKLEAPNGKTYCEDFFLSVKLFLYAQKISKLDKIYYNYNRLNVSSLLNSANEKATLEELFVYQDIIDFLNNNHVLDRYEEVMAWRILKCTQHLILDSNKHNEFLLKYPNNWSCFIMSCPRYFCNRKIRVYKNLIIMTI